MTEDIYDDNYLNMLVDNDEITTQELGIMHWYDLEGDLSYELKDSGGGADINETADLYPQA